VGAVCRSRCAPGKARIDGVVRLLPAGEAALVPQRSGRSHPDSTRTPQLPSFKSTW
jgi:hypothetical protein